MLKKAQGNLLSRANLIPLLKKHTFLNSNKCLMPLVISLLSLGEIPCIPRPVWVLGIVYHMASGASFLGLCLFPLRHVQLYPLWNTEGNIYLGFQCPFSFFHSFSPSFVFFLFSLYSFSFLVYCLKNFRPLDYPELWLQSP